jgi:predicted Kef-type K+ transport protein
MRFPKNVQTHITGFAEDAFMSGFQAGMWVNVLLASIGLVLVLIFVGGPFRLKQLSSVERKARARLTRYTHHIHG